MSADINKYQTIRFRMRMVQHKFTPTSIQPLPMTIKRQLRQLTRPQGAS
jgi:hypothetical protein